MLPFTFNDSETGFEFMISSTWGRPPAALLADRDVFAWFKCFSQEWTETVWSAVAFAQACDGLFTDDRGMPYATIEEAVAFARQEAPIA